MVDRGCERCYLPDDHMLICSQLHRYVFAFWWLSGYLNTCAYVCAPVRAPSSGGPRAGALMALLFQLSSLLALLLAEGVQLMMFQKSPGA